MFRGHMRSCACVAIFHVQTGHLTPSRSGFNVDVDHTLLKPHFTAHGNDLLAQVFNHLDQLEGADVRMCCKQNVARRARLHKLVHHFATQMARVFDLAVKLAVGEGACAAFAKLHIALGIQILFAPQSPGVFGALAHGAAAFDDDGFETHLRQAQGCKNTARAKAHHHRAFPFMLTKMSGRMTRGLPRHVGCCLNVGVACKLAEQ